MVAMKVNAGPAVDALFSFANLGFQIVSAKAGALNAGEKLSAVWSHSVWSKIEAKKEILMAVLGLALVFHGACFQHLFICTQVVRAFFFERAKEAICSARSDVTAAYEKAQADAPAATKKEKAAAQKGNADATKKALKMLDSDRILKVATELLIAAVACVVIIHGGFAKSVAVAYGLVTVATELVEGVLEFPQFEDLSAWTGALQKLVLWAVFVPLSVVAMPLAIALLTASVGAWMAIRCGAPLVGKAALVGDNPASSQQSLAAWGGLTAAGSAWQLWSWAAGGGLAWYTSLAYLPAVAAEGALSLL